MFMVRDEFMNIKNLLKVRIKTQSRYFIWLFIIAALLLLSTLIGTILHIIHNTGYVSFHTVADHSNTFLLALVFGYLFGITTYRNTNDKLSVYPQTNNSRYISWLLTNYILVVVIALIALLRYLLQLGVLSIFLVFTDSIHFALNIDFEFIIAGFLVYLVYCFLIVALFELIGAILRKWRYFAAMALAAVLSLMLTNIAAVIEYAPKALAFLIKEPSLIVFLLKAAGAWIVLTAAALVLNRYTVYHKSQSQAAKRGFIAVYIIIAVVIIVVVPIILITVPVEGSSSGPEETVYIEEAIEGTYPGADEIRIDVSHLPEGSRVDIKGDNIRVYAEGEYTEYAQDFTNVSISVADSMQFIKGDTLIIKYYRPTYTAYGIDSMQFANPQVTAYLEGSTLYIDYTIDNTQIIIMPIWSIAGQFERYQGRSVLPPDSFWHSEEIGNASIYITTD